MTYAIFYIARPEGGYLAVCESFNGWNHPLPELTADSMAQAEASLRSWITKRLMFVGYVVPQENRRVAERLAA